jgi:hypothetical protein
MKNETAGRMYVGAGVRNFYIDVKTINMRIFIYIIVLLKSPTP